MRFWKMVQRYGREEAERRLAIERMPAFAQRNACAGRSSLDPSETDEEIAASWAKAERRFERRKRGER
jgi:hypothetical protein